MRAEEFIDEACWKGYRKDGMKTMFGKRYPNCVKKKSESIDQQDVAEGSTDDDTAKTAYMYGLRHGREGVGNNMDRAKAEWGDNFKYYNAGFLKGRNKKAQSLKAVGQGYGNKEQGVAEGSQQISEYRDRLLQYVKSLLPKYPEYVLKDWLVPNKGDFSNLPDTELKNGIMEKLKGAGLTPNTKWQLVPNMQFTMDMFEPMTKQRLIGRAGGSSDLGMGIPRDKERHATQAALAQQQGGVRKEPVLLIKTDKGYELLEGWHRTIQHFAKYPDGYTGPAYVAVAQPSVAEGSLNEFAPGGDDEDGDEDPYRYPKPTRYRRSADYFNQFEADHFDREDFDDATGVFKGYQDGKHIAHFKFDDPAQTGGDDSGQGWYYEPKYNNNSGNNNTAAPAVDRSAERKRQELDMIDAFLKSGNRPNPDSQIGRLMKRYGMSEGARVARKAGQPADSKKHSDLYTDENPRGTITGLKFATAADARASVSKIRSSGRSHAHKIQAAVAMEQRARAAGKAEAAAVYRRYINANKKTESLEAELKAITEDLRKWFKQKWVRFGPDGKIRGDCARGSSKEGKPKCLPQAKAHALGKKGRASAGARKRRQDPDANRSGKAINVKTK